jgi:ABC-type uncharacterized transport system YnjBCD ATPase subunit
VTLIDPLLERRADILLALASGCNTVTAIATQTGHRRNLVDAALRRMKAAGDVTAEPQAAARGTRGARQTLWRATVNR